MKQFKTVWRLFSVFLFVLFLMAVWIVVAGSSGVRVDIYNSTDMPMKEIKIDLNKQVVNMQDIQKNDFGSIVFDNKYEVELVHILYKTDKQYIESVPVYIEMNSPMYIKIRVQNNGQVILEDAKHLLLEFHPLEVFKNYWRRIISHP